MQIFSPEYVCGGGGWGWGGGGGGGFAELLLVNGKEIECFVSNT